MADEDLNSYVSNYTGFNDWLIRQRYEVLRHHFVGIDCVELGPATGEGTAYLLDHFSSVVAVDGSQVVVDKLIGRFGDARLTAVCSYFEDLELDRRFDTVVLAHVLEHVDDPQRVLEVARRLVKPTGVIIIDVPNGMSLHRQIGVELGLLSDVTELHEGDLSIGHKRVYTPQTFRAEVERAGLRIDHFGGVFIKILSNAQTEAAFDEAQLRALLTVGERYPQIAAEMYVTARPVA